VNTFIISTCKFFTVEAFFQTVFLLKMNELRLLVVTTSFPLSHQSVSGVFIKKLTEYYPSNIKAFVLTPCDNTVKIEATTKNYTLFCFRYAPKKLQVIAHQPGGIPVALRNNKSLLLLLPVFILAQLLACIRYSKRVDVIHANWSINGFLAGIAAWITAKPVVTTIRGEDVNRAASSSLYRYFLGFCIRNNYKIVCVSEAISIKIRKMYPQFANKIVFIPNGVDNDLLSYPIKYAHSSNNSPVSILTIGSLIPRKGVDTIIQAIKQVKSNVVKLTIVGSGSEEDNLKKLVNRLQLNSVVSFKGSIPAAQIGQYLSSADIFILASYSEGRPNVILEAFAAGIPVIASDIDGNRELVADGINGLLFKAGSVQALSAQIRKLLANTDIMTSFANEGRDFIIRNKLVWPETCSQYVKLFNDALSNTGKSQCAD